MAMDENKSILQSKYETMGLCAHHSWHSMHTLLDLSGYIPIQMMQMKLIYIWWACEHQ